MSKASVVSRLYLLLGVVAWTVGTTAILLARAKPSALFFMRTIGVALLFLDIIIVVSRIKNIQDVGDLWFIVFLLLMIVLIGYLTVVDLILPWFSQLRALYRRRQVRLLQGGMRCHVR